MSLEGLSLQLGISWDALARHLEFNPAEIQGFNHAKNGKNSQTNLTACCVGGKRKWSVRSKLPGLVQGLVS